MKYKYHIIVSFAGKDRNIVDESANCLQAKGVKVFYGKIEKAEVCRI